MIDTYYCDVEVVKDEEDQKTIIDVVPIMVKQKYEDWVKVSDVEKYIELYEMVDEFMCTLGAEGSITIDTDSKWANKIMGALYDIDGGFRRNDG